MTLSMDDVAHIAGLAKLSLSAEEMNRYGEQLSAILDYAAILNQLDTSAIPPTATVLPLRNVMREDKPVSSLSPRDVLANAPDQVDNTFRVRAILE